jgi:hypothetical protein
MIQSSLIFARINNSNAVMYWALATAFRLARKTLAMDKPSWQVNLQVKMSAWDCN